VTLLAKHGEMHSWQEGRLHTSWLGKKVRLAWCQEFGGRNRLCLRNIVAGALRVKCKANVAALAMVHSKKVADYMGLWLRRQLSAKELAR
jgi:hypothetical protein